MVRHSRSNPNYPTIISPFGVTAEALGQMLPAIGSIPDAIGAQLGSAAEARASSLLLSQPLVARVVDKIAKRVDAHVRPIRELRGLVLSFADREVYVDAAFKPVRQALHDLAPLLEVSIITMYPTQFHVRLPDDAHKSIIGLMVVAAYVTSPKNHAVQARSVLDAAVDVVQMAAHAPGQAAARARLHTKGLRGRDLADQEEISAASAERDAAWRAADRPVEGKVYALTGPNSIASGNDWAGSEVKKRYYRNNEGWVSDDHQNASVSQLATGVATSMLGARVEMMDRGRTAVVLKGAEPIYAASEQPIGAAEWAQIKAVAALRASSLATSPIPKTGEGARVYAARLEAATTRYSMGAETWYRDFGNGVVSFVGTQKHKEIPYVFSLFVGKQTTRTSGYGYSTFDAMVAGLVEHANSLIQQGNNAAANKEIRKAARAERAARPTDVRPGMIFALHWGYSITACSFYQVVHVSASGKMATVRELDDKLVSGDRMVGKKVPIPDDFRSGAITGRITVDDDGETRIKIKTSPGRSKAASLWDGEPVSVNSLD